MHDTARAILETARAANCEILLPTDLVVAEEFRPNPPTRTVGVGAVPAGSMALDVGPETKQAIEQRLRSASTLVWNGPLGAFETPPFDAATVGVAQIVASLTQSGALKSIGGGGDTVAALRHAGVADRMTYVSTAGCAFLEWLEGKTLPGVAALTAT
jgi:phosphoglycerate kinase